MREATALAPGGSSKPPADLSQARLVLANPRFMALFLSQILTQVGGNMVLFGLTIQVFLLTDRASTSVSILLLTFLVPAVIFGAVAGVYVDRYDRRRILVSTNVARGLLFVPLIFFDDQLLLIFVVTAIVATLTTFFAPAESAMMPFVVPRSQLLTANGIFIFALQASFVLGFAVLGPLATNLVGVQWLIVLVVGMYLLAGLLCWTLPPAPPTQGDTSSGAFDSAGRAIRATGAQLVEGLGYIRHHHNIFWSLTYLTITSSLIGVLGVLGPAFAVRVLNLTEKDFVIIVLPLGAGLVLGILLLNAYGRYVSRRRLIEGGLAALAIALTILGLAQRINFGPSGSGVVPLLTVVIAVAFTAGIAYAFVAVPAQTALQEELPSDVRGRVFGVLNMLVSMASFLPIIIVGTVADLVGTSAVILISALVIGLTCVASLFLDKQGGGGGAVPGAQFSPVDPLTVTTSSNLTGPVQLRYVDDQVGDETRILYLATPVVPGKAGPAAGVAPAPVGPTHDDVQVEP